jgi:hypothetical protein
VYRHRICDRLLLLRLHLVATIIPLANARRQVVHVDVVNVFIFIDVVVCCAVTVVAVVVRRAITLVVDAIVHRTLMEKDAKSCAALLCHVTRRLAESCVRTVKSTNAM